MMGDLALELRERQQHVQGRPTHAGRRVERLGDREKARSSFVERLELGSRTSLHIWSVAALKWQLRVRSG